MAHSFTQEYFQIPVVTRAYTTACVLTTAAVQLDVISPFQLYFNPDLIIRRYQIGVGFHTGEIRNVLDHFTLVGLAPQLLGLLADVFFLGQAFIVMLVYVWSRRHPLIRMNFFGLLDFQAPFLPWVLMGFSLLLGNSVVVDLLGISVGHIYYFLEDVFPNQPGGKKLLTTPELLRAMFDDQQEDEEPDYRPPHNQQPDEEPHDFN
ncbi:unnamed protein product [Pleuronectes platessa]|uniref:Derlin n=1 Tax=Pleuronectes platessa TaxID=8262 RepID=A0A9N7TKI5_PLEPL|nr:unnamed protein product [Pleuronectes platessa]